MAAILRCAAINEQAGRNKEYADKKELNTEVGFSDAIIPSFEVTVYAIIEWGRDL